MAIRREKNRKPFKVSRNLNGTPEALTALGRATGWISSHWNTGEFETTRVAADPKTKQIFVPGQGNVYLQNEHGKNNFAESSGVAHQEQLSYRTGTRKG